MRGSARSETRTMTDKAIGSVHYIAPEQARGDLTDERADIYSVGVMLYEMVTGQLPFEADNAVSVAIMQLQSDPSPPKELNPNIPGRPGGDHPDVRCRKIPQPAVSVCC